MQNCDVLTQNGDAIAEWIFPVEREPSFCTKRKLNESILEGQIKKIYTKCFTSKKVAAQMLRFPNLL